MEILRRCVQGGEHGDRIVDSSRAGSSANSRDVALIRSLYRFHIGDVRCELLDSLRGGGGVVGNYVISGDSDAGQLLVTGIQRRIRGIIAIAVADVFDAQRLDSA